MRGIIFALGLLLSGCAGMPCPANPEEDRVIEQGRADLGKMQVLKWEGLRQAGHCVEVRWMKVTAYSFLEPAHHRYGHLNCQGTILDDTQCAADLRYYPTGTVLEIEGDGLRTVTDCGHLVRGRSHIDLHFCSLHEMRAWGKRIVRVRIVKMP